MTRFKKGCFLLIFSVLASCSSDELGPPRDVAYYMEHDEERKAIIAKCDNDPGRLKLHPNCDNAYRARTRLMFTGSNAVSAPPPIEDLLRPPPVNYSRMTQEEKNRYHSMTSEEKDRYNEEQKRLEQLRK